MMKNFSKFNLSFLILVFVLVAANSTVFAQKSSSIVSGEYGSILLGVDSNGKLTGYFSEGTGEGIGGKPQFSCEFFISGDKQTDGNYKIKTWYPGDKDVIGGELKLVEENGKKSVNLKLDSEHGGCGNVNPMISRGDGETFELTEVGNWESIRVVSAKKGYFYVSEKTKAPQKIWVIRKDVVRVSQTKGEKANVTFVSDKGRKKSGWINTRDFYDVSAPPSNN